MRWIKPGLILLIALLSLHCYASPIVGNRVFKVVNECPFPVWFSANSAVAKNKSGSNSCTSTADCIEGAVCNANQQCYYAPPQPADGNYKLAANGGTNQVSMPIYQNADNKIWGGRVAGRTGCASGVCETADCGSGEKGCNLGKGFRQPATIAEFTLNKTTSDFYDVSLVNGMSIPMALGPTTPPPLSHPYRCTTPGSVTSSTALGKCSWEMLPPSNDFKVVLTGGTACTTDANCSADKVCGISSDSRRTPRLQKTCGKLIGFWNPNEICGQDKNYGAPFYCNQPLPAPQNNLTLYNLYKCNQIDTCYKSGASNTCCGCVNWDTLGIDVPPPPATKACYNSNPTWVSTVQPKLAWIKKGCPSVYTFPYDDPSSTFTCKVDNNNVNSVNYTITFCPGGKTAGVKG